MQISSNFNPIYSHNWKINFLQCTPNGFIKHTELCNILQLTAAYHSDLGGISFTDMQKFNQAWVLSRMHVEIEELPKWNDTITVTTWIIDLQGSRSIRAFDVHVNEKKIVGAVTYWAVFNTKIRKSETLALPHEHFIKYPEKLSTNESFIKIDINKDAELYSERKIVLSDLDIVYHVNNVKYLEWCLDTVDSKLILNQQLKSFDMDFLRELKLNDNVKIFSVESNNQTYCAVNKENKISFSLLLNWK